MSFYKELKNFFLKNDPGRVRLAKKIAGKFKTKSSQKIVINRLIEVYKSGGPSNLTVSKIAETPKQEEIIEDDSLE